MKKIIPFTSNLRKNRYISQAIKFMFCIVLVIGCKKDRSSFPDEKKPNITPDYQAIKVSFPNGTTINYADYSIFSLADDSKLDASGNAKVPYNKGKTNIAWLMDKNNNLVMAGFVNDTAKTINAASTAKVMLYYVYAIPMMPQSIQNEFINTIGGFNGFADWANQFAALLKTDPSVLSKDGYIDALKNAMANMAKKKVGGNVGIQTLGKQMSVNNGGLNKVAERNAEIDVRPGEKKSGIQIHSLELSKVTIDNFYRRRAHAFFYKTKFRNLQNEERGILSEINETTASDRDESLSPTSAVNSFMGLIGTWIENRNSGEILDFAVKKNGPFNFQLKDYENMAFYKTRVIGPGIRNGSTKFTNAERTKLFRLETETLAMDFLMPVVASFVSSKIDGKPGKDATEAQKRKYEVLVESVQKIVEEMVKGSPAVYDEMKGGNYKMALQKLLESIYSGTVSATKENFFKIISIAANTALDDNLYIGSALDNALKKNSLMKWLELTDKLMNIGDYANMVYHLGTSNAIEEWELILYGGKVSLKFVKGYDSLINTSEETKIIANIRNMNETGGEQHPYFEWSTTGKYGKLRDTLGHSGTSFATAGHTVSYQSTTNSNNLTDGDNIDYIYVKASFNNILIGMDTIAVNVRKVNYEMKPTDATVTGKKYENAANNVTLHLQKTVTAVRDIPSHPDLDFKIEWSTPGAYGNLVGSTTTYNDDDIVYKATSEQVGIFTENITARIYAKNKNETNYWFYGQTKGTVKIDNEQKKKILSFSVKVFHKDSQYLLGTQTRHVCQKYAGVSIPEDVDAESYSVKFYPFSAPVGAPLFQTWKAGSVPPSIPKNTDDPGYGGGHYNVVYMGNSADFPNTLTHAPDVTFKGSATVTVYLK